MEFMYADAPNPESYFVNSGPNTVGYDKLVNGYLGNSIQIFNPKEDESITNNTTENSVVKISDTNFVTLDSNLIIPFNDFDDKLTNTINLPVDFPSNIKAVYDTVRFHIRSGYNLSNLDGVICTIEYQDNDQSYVTVASILIKKGTQQVYTLNTSPVTIGSDIYDKYVEIKIPSLVDMQNKFNAATQSNKPNTLAGKISNSGDGFNSISPIRVGIYQVQSTSDYNGYTKYDSAKVATFSLEQEDPFKEIGAVIRPSDKGEFYEFFATDDGGFIEDFILFQNSIGNSYFLYHEIEVLEQIGAAYIQTSNFSSIQTNAYDIPNLFRPIIRNSSVASSFLLRYTMTLVNNKDQTRVVRVSTSTSTNPGKYGTRITPISIGENPQTFSIYNKLYQPPNIIVAKNPNDMTSPSETATEIKEVVKFSNIFVQQNRVSTTINNLRLETDTSGNVNLTQESKTDSDEIIYGKGKGTIEISPFDNYYKFVFYKKGQDGIPVLIDLESSGSYKIVFIDNKGKKLKIPSLVDKNIANPSKGELAFKIGESNSTKILQFTNRNFYISNLPMDPPEVEEANVTSASSVASPSSKRLEAESMNRFSKPSVGKEITKLTKDGRVVKTSSATKPINTEQVPIKPPMARNNVVNIGTSSVLYRGKWIKEDEEVSITPIPSSPAIPTYSNIPSYSREAISGLGQSVVTKPTSVRSVKPVTSPRRGLNPDNSSSSQSPTNERLRGSALISALSTLINSFDQTGWTPNQIYTYFFVPGNAGYVTYPNITQSQFEEAANGILTSAELGLLFGDSNVVPDNNTQSGNRDISTDIPRRF